VHAGRIAREQKRVQDLAPFLTALDASGTPWELDVFGDGPDLAALRTELAAWVTRGAARLHGSVAPGVVHGALLRAHALLLFSDFEGLPLVLLESMARSVVPVVTRIPSGISDILADGRDALLFPVGDTAAAAAAVRSLADPERHRTLALAARATAEGFDLERQLDLYAERIRALAAAAPDLSGRPSRHRAGQRLS
jgi:glycosyltransferase involved in cell wall biosynthesis